MKNQKGFSLVELLVVVIIIAIIAAIAIPNLLASRRSANEASAISSLRTIHSAQSVYLTTMGNNTNYSPDLATLGAAASGSLIDPALAAAVDVANAKSGYFFDINAGTQVYCATATASSQGTTGVRSFAVSEPGVIYEYAAAIPATVCPATGIFAQGAGVAIK
jgi:type IV pilus assembly protein PilA